MKKFSFLLAIIFFFACTEENNTPTKPVDDDFDPDGAIKLKMGDFIGVSGHSVSGMATIYDDQGTKFVVLDPFNSQNGPDLKVYLSSDANATSYINLGELKSTTGKQSYEITGSYDLDEYPYVLVWCQEFSVGFGKAITE